MGNAVIVIIRSIISSVHRQKIMPHQANATLITYETQRAKKIPMPIATQPKIASIVIRADNPSALRVRSMEKQKIFQLAVDLDEEILDADS
jgi:hypothetical protein